VILKRPLPFSITGSRGSAFWPHGSWTRRSFG